LFIIIIIDFYSCYHRWSKPITFENIVKEKKEWATKWNLGEKIKSASWEEWSVDVVAEGCSYWRLHLVNSVVVAGSVLKIRMLAN